MLAVLVLVLVLVLVPLTLLLLVLVLLLICLVREEILVGQTGLNLSQQEEEMLNASSHATTSTTCR